MPHMRRGAPAELWAALDAHGYAMHDLFKAPAGATGSALRGCVFVFRVRSATSMRSRKEEF